MADNHSNSLGSGAKVALTCPHCEKLYQVSADEVKELVPDQRQRIKCRTCGESFLCYVDSHGHLNSARSEYQVVYEKSATIEPSSVASEAQGLDSAATLIDANEANQALATYLKFAQQNPKLSAELLATSGSGFAEQFQRHLQESSFEKLAEANNHAFQRLEQLQKGINQLLDEIVAQISRDVNALILKKQQTVDKISRLLVAVHEEAHSALAPVLNLFRQASADTAVLIQQHKDLTNDYKAAREQTKQDVSQNLIRELVDNKLLQETLDEYFATHLNERREELIKRLPVLFDAVESEIDTWEMRDDVEDSMKTEVLRVLRKIQRRINDWQNRCGINRIAPAPGEVYDNRQHQLVATKPAEQADQAHTIESLEQSGYFVERNGQEKEFLRKARVVVWDEPQSLPTGTEQAGPE